MSLDPPRLQDLTDADLVQRCVDGDQAAWRALVQRYQRLVFTVARRAALDEHAAADVLQSVCEKVHRHLAHLTQPDRLTSRERNANRPCGAHGC